MLFYSYLAFLAFVIYLVSGIYILLLKPKSILHRTFFYFCLIFSIEAVCISFINIESDKETALILHHISSVAKCLTPGLLLAFFLVLSKKYKVLPYGIIFPVVNIPTIIFLIKISFEDFFIKDIQWESSYWFIQANTSSYWFISFVVYYFVFSLSSFFLLRNWHIRTKLKKEKNQSLLIMICLVVVFVIDFTYNIILRDVMNNMPYTDFFTSLIWMISIFYTILKYRLISFTPEASTKKIISQMKEFLIFVRTDGKIISANNYTLKMLGYKEDELIDKEFTSIVLEKDLFPDGFFIDSKKPEGFNLHLIAKADESIPVFLRFSQIYDKFGDHLGNMFVGHDTRYENRLKHEIEERKIVEKQLIKARAKAEESDKLKSAFLANMSHEIRTPMNGILGFTHLLDDPDLDESKRKEYIKIIKNSGNHLLKLINDIIDISKIEANQVKISKEKFHLNALCRELMKSLSNEKVPVYFHAGLDEPDCQIITDKTRLIQIMSNILSNAIKFSHKGSINFGYNKKGNFIEFFVKDTGIGISDKDQKVIFDRFTQINEPSTYGGTGLGLAISKNLTELLGGKIWLESRQGEGSCFYFTIPYEI